MSQSKSGRLGLWIALLTFSVGLPAQAQNSTAAPTVALEEIVVTARKREENLQDVPLAVSAISAEQIERAGIRSVEDVVARDPSMSFDLGIAPYDTRIVIRGLSPTRGRPNVATLVDGIDVSSEAIGVAGGSLLINPRLVDVQRIEVVKGPQSALYGRSAFAGAISYITADPTREVSGSVAAEVAAWGQNEVRSSISLPLGDTLGMRLNGYKFDSRGQYKNSVTGAFVGGARGTGGSFSVKWQPTDSYTLKFRSEYSDDHFDEQATANVNFNGLSFAPASASSCRTYAIANPAGGANIVSPGPVLDASCVYVDANPALPANVVNLARLFDTASGNRGIYDDMAVPSYRGAIPGRAGLSVNFNPDYTLSTDNGLTAPEFAGTSRRVLRLSTVQELDAAFGKFSSLTGYTLANVVADQDFDKTAITTIQQTLKTRGRTEQFSQELRFTSDFDGRLQFITGLQYWTERADQFDRNNTVFGSGTACVMVAVVPFPTPTGVCAQPTFTAANVSPYMDDVANARKESLVRRFVTHRSAYLELELKLAEQFRVVAEGRYVDEDNEVVGPITAGSQGPSTVVLCGATGNCGVAASIPYAAQPGLPRTFAGPTVLSYGGYTRNDKYFTPKVTAQWQPSRDLNVYASYSVGKKPGGFGTLTISAFGLAPRPDVEFEPERIKVYEFGTKWTSANRRLQVNASAFKQDFTDKQVSSQVIIGTTLGTRITNAGGAVLEGLELSTQFRATPELTLGAGLTHFLKYEYTDYTTLSGGAAEIARVGNCTPVTTAILSGTTYQAQTVCQLSRNGNKLEDTPAMALALNASYRRPFGRANRSWFADLDMSYTGQRFLEDDNTIWLESYWNTNVRFGIEGERWSATVYCDNVFDDATVRSAGTGPGNSFAVVRTGVRVGAAGAIPANLRNPVAAFGIAIPTSVFAQMPPQRTVGLRVAYKF